MVRVKEKVTTTLNVLRQNNNQEVYPCKFHRNKMLVLMAFFWVKLLCGVVSRSMFIFNGERYVTAMKILNLAKLWLFLHALYYNII
jgi:hypothetical protein